MRTMWLGVLLASTLAVQGCSHLGADSDGDWHARPVVNDHVEVVSQKDGSWEPVAAPHHRRWERPKVVEVSYGPQAEQNYRLDTGDTLRIFVYGQENLSRLYTIDANGAIMMPLIGIIRARGLTTYALARQIRGQLATRFVRDPHVTVDVHENRPFFILGEVRQPGKYPYVHGMTIEMAVAIAGGYTPRANERRASVSRKQDGSQTHLEGGPGFVLRAGDTVTIDERFF